MKKLIKKNEFINILKNKYPVSDVVENYSKLPDSIIVDGDTYNLNNTVISDGDNIESVELNYYCKTCYKFLFTYKIENNVLVAVNKLIENYKNLN